MDDKNISKLLNKAGYYHNYSENENKAIELCNEILKKDVENIDALLIKAGALSHVNKEKEDFQLTEKIIKKWSNHWEAYYLMGLLLFNTNEKMAMQNFNNSITIMITLDNTISAAQISYFVQQRDYKKYLKSAKELDIFRYTRYMEDYWEWEII